MRIKSKLRVEVMKVISYPTLVSVKVTTCPDVWVGGGLYDNNAILNSVDVVVEVGVELGNMNK